MSRSLTFERTLAASPEIVFDAWANPEVLARWMGPGEMACDISAWDLKVGGAYSLTMKGTECFPLSGAFTAIDRPNHLAFTWQWEGDEVVTSLDVTFEAVDGGTRMVVVHSGFSTDEAKDNHNQGWTGTWPKLDRVLAA